MKIVATTSLPAVDRPNADRWNATRSCQFSSETVHLLGFGEGHDMYTVQLSTLISD